jgi:integrase
VKASASGSNPLNTSKRPIRVRQHRGASYTKVCDERKRPIRGLWARNGRFYAQITIEDPHNGAKKVKRVPLESVTTAAQARDALHALMADRRKGALPVLKRTPKFADFADTYLAFHQAAKDTKRASTLKTEGYALDRLKEHMGSIRLDKINRKHVDGFIAGRQKDKKSARTVNLEVTVLRNVLNKAIDDKLLNRLPTENLRPLKKQTTKRPLATSEQIENLCKAALEPQIDQETGKTVCRLNGEQFADYLKLLVYSGARRTEALHLKWSHVDWKNRQLSIGAEGATKNGQWRPVDFNPKLEAHLKDMEGRKVPDSDWIFPSPRRGEKDRPAKTFVETLRLVRKTAKLPKFGFHDCRHYFISTCVMSGIDYMTIARWVGHQDGGLLIGKVYGHLSNEHAQRQAERIQFA